MKNVSGKLAITLVLVSILVVGLFPGCKTNISPTPPSTSTSLTTSSPKISTTTPPPSTGPLSTPFNKAPIDISMLSDGQTVRVNLVRFTGKVPSSDASIKVNNSPVSFDSKGNYYVYLDLQKGQNVIEVKTVNGVEIKIDKIGLFFDPPLICQLYNPDFDPKVNYLENSKIKINGYISKPTAKVKVNGETQEVHADGTFTFSYSCVKGGNQVITVATLQDEIDEYMLRWLVADNGHPGIIPGNYYYPNSPYGNNYVTSLIESDHDGFLIAGDYKQTINLKAGESTILTFGVSIGKINTAPVMASVALAGSAEPNIQVKVEPTSYIAYPRIQYYSPVLISASAQCLPGDYQYHITYSDVKTNLTLGLIVSVK